MTRASFDWLPKKFIAAWRLIVGNTINKPFEKSKQDVCLTRNKLPVNFLFMNEEANRVERAFRALGMEAPEFQRKVGIQSQHWNNWKTRGIPKDKLPVVSAVIHRSTDWILTGQEASEDQAHGIQGQLDDVEGVIEASSQKAPQFREPGPDYLPVRMGGFHLQAGVIGYGLDFLEEEKAPIFFRADWYSVNGYKPERLVACQIKGDSMEPRLYAGDIVVINLDDTQPIDGSVFAINYEGELVIKRLKRDRGEWQLSSDNADKVKHPDKVCSSDICILIGKVVYRQSSEI